MCALVQMMSSNVPMASASPDTFNVTLGMIVATIQTRMIVVSIARHMHPIFTKSIFSFSVDFPINLYEFLTFHFFFAYMNSF